MNYIAFDIETTGLDPYRGAKTFAWASCDEIGNTLVSRNDEIDFREKLQKFFNDVSVSKVCHNFHFEMAMLLEEGYLIPEETEWHDTMLLSQLLENLAVSHALDVVSERYSPDVDQRRYWRGIDEKIQKAFKIYGSYDKIPKKLMDQYQRNDVERTELLFLTLFPIVKKSEKLYQDYLNEIELVKTTIAMERRGLMLAKNECNILLEWMNKEIDHTDKRSNEILKDRINLNSGKQVSHVLYNVLKLPILCTTKSGAPSVDKNTLEELRNKIDNCEILDLILKQRSYTKGIAMVEGYKKSAGVNNIIHPHINTNHAATGRESSQNPNMQNISKELSIRTRYGVPARRCFRARPKHIWLLCDYAGIEMRLAVQATGSKRLYDLLEEDFDFHDACAISFYGAKYTDEQDPKIKKLLRSAAKNTRFAMLYGAGIEKVALGLQLNFSDAKKGYDRDREEWPEFYTMMRECTLKAKEYGGIETFFGRFLKVNPEKAYKATDYLIQGSAAGLFKRAQNKLHSYFTKQEGMHFILPVHDEFIMELERKHLPNIEIIKKEIEKNITQIEGIKVKISVEWKMSTYTWDKAK